LVIADGKRNDIGSTAQCYSAAYLGKTDIDEGISEAVFDVDALTVNPYLGVDGIKPFIDDCVKYTRAYCSGQDIKQVIRRNSGHTHPGRKKHL